MDVAQAPADPSGLVVELNIASGGLREGATPYSIKTQCFRFAVSADWQPTKSPVFGRNAQIAAIARPRADGSIRRFADLWFNTIKRSECAPTADMCGSGNCRT
jgi:hypothetical protein